MMSAGEARRSKMRAGFGIAVVLLLFAPALSYEVLDRSIDTGGSNLGNWFGDEVLWPRVFLHAANFVLLFVALRGIGFPPGVNLGTALLFAVHPLRIEALLWPDTLALASGTLWLVPLAVYTFHLRRPSVARLAASSIAALPAIWLTTAGLALPLVLGLLATSRDGTQQDRQRHWVELGPLLAVAAVRAALVVSDASHAAALPSAVGIAQMATAHVVDLLRFCLPLELAPFRPDLVAAWWAPLAAVAIVLATGTIARLRAQLPLLAAGWLLYLATLWLSSGVALPNRATYVPHIGLVFAVAALAGALEQGRKARFVNLVLPLWIAALGALTVVHLQHWRGPDALLRHALQVHGDRAVPHLELATRREREGDTDVALAHLRAALRAEPDNAEAHRRLAQFYDRRANGAAAAYHLRAALAAAPHDARIHYALGRLHHDYGDIDAAIGYYQRALEIAADDAEAHLHLAQALRRRGRSDAVIRHATRALELNPRAAAAHAILGEVYAGSGRLDEAVRHYESATALTPNDPEIWHRLGNVRARLGALSTAVDAYRTALALDPESEAIRRHLELAAETVRATAPVDTSNFIDEP